MAKTLNDAVQDVLGAQLMQIVQLQVQNAELAEALAVLRAAAPLAAPTTGDA